jgi:putative transposase
LQSREHAIKKPRYTEKQIMAALNQADRGASARDLCKRYGIASATFYRWRAKREAEKLMEAARLKQLEDENRRLRLLVAELTLRNHALKLVVSKE